MMQVQPGEIAVIGGGLAGLTAATIAARHGTPVVLYEKAHTVGGRAVTRRKGEFYFNMGPHALYRGGQAAQILRELGVTWTGGVPATAGYAFDRGTLHTLPGGFVSLLTTDLFRWPTKLEVARLLGSLQKLDPDAVQRVSVRQWGTETIRHPDVRALVEALFRLATYSNDPERLGRDSHEAVKDDPSMHVGD